MNRSWTRSPNRSFLAWILLLLLIAVNGYAWVQSKPAAVPGFSGPISFPRGSQAGEPFFRTHIASSSFDDFVHSPSVALLPNGGIMTVWFAGTREGAADVEIRGARFDPENQEWSEEFALVSRKTTEAALQRSVRKLGNPVIALAPDNRLWLFYVSVSVGGWSGSAINTMYSEDGGITWSKPTRLITSPFLNVSTLVRNPPVFHQDGSIGLPVYHEFLGKFGEYLRLSPEGEIIDKFRLSKGRHSLQPTVAPLTKDSAVAFLRNAGHSSGKVLATFTTDRGQTWSEPAGVDPWNPNSALAAISMDNLNNTDDDAEEILLVLNDLRDGRHSLALYQTDSKLYHWNLLEIFDKLPDNSDDMVRLKQFRTVLDENFLALGMTARHDQFEEIMHHFQSRACSEAGEYKISYDYPSLLASHDGLFHVVYTWNKAFIKHVTFNRAWLEMQKWMAESYSAELVSY